MNSTTEDFERSFERAEDSEKYREKWFGFGGGRKAQALTRLHLPQLAERIDADRTSRYRDRDVWRALRGKTDGIAARAY